MSEERIVLSSLRMCLALLCAIAGVIFLMPNFGMAQGGSAGVANDCAPDLAKFCSRITPGEGRKVACLISYSDRISPRCRLTAYLAGKALAENMLRLERLAFRCSADIQSLCYNFGIGGGRIYDCLKKNKARLVSDCRQSLPQFERQYMKQ